MSNTQQLIDTCLANASDRLTFWAEFTLQTQVNTMAEIGVFRGKYAEYILKANHGISKYYMIDPWRHLDNWNKPANRSNTVFNEFLEETKKRTEFARDRCIILRGKTTEVIDQIPDESLDYVYIDGDYTLRGITIDLIRVYSKIRQGGFIGGDDFVPGIWQHDLSYEPTLIFPFAVYFAEAVGQHIWALPHNQFLIEKRPESTFEFITSNTTYDKLALSDHLNMGQILRRFVRSRFR